MARSFSLVSLAGLVGVVAVVAVPVRFYARMNAAEQNAARSLVAIGEAQRTFRGRAPDGGYATDLASLTTPCPGEKEALLRRDSIEPGYRFVVRATENVTARGTDCHGRPMASDYYASGEPATALNGRQAFAMTARRRIYVYFDGVAPREADFGPGGLAIPLVTLDTFKIP